MIKIKYYDFTELLSYNKPLNFVIGIRGRGKTYRFKKWGIDDLLKNGRQFMWVRRYKTEIKKMKDKFFDDIAMRYPNHTFAVKGDNQFGCFTIDDKVAGYYVTLSVELSYKSIPFPLVDKIIFDEFLIARNVPLKYLSDDVTALMSLIDTVFRNRELDPNAVQPRGCYCLANMMSFINPYFSEFHIKPFEGRFMVRDDFIVENDTDQEYVSARLTTRFGKLFDSTRYGDFALRNKSIETDDSFVKPKPANAVFQFGTRYNNYVIGFWLDRRNGYLFASSQYDPQSKRIYALTREDHSPNTYFLRNYKYTMLDDLPYFFENGLLYFTYEYVKVQVYEVLALLRCK